MLPNCKNIPFTNLLSDKSTVCNIKEHYCLVNNRYSHIVYKYALLILLTAPKYRINGITIYNINSALPQKHRKSLIEMNRLNDNEINEYDDDDDYESDSSDSDNEMVANLPRQIKSS